MNNRAIAVLLLLPSLAAATPEYESEAQAAQARFYTAVENEIPVLGHVIATTPQAVLWHGGCRPPIIHIDNVQNTIYADNVPLGSNARKDFTALCSGRTVWTDSQNIIYLDKTPLGTSFHTYRINHYTEDVLWLDTENTLHKGATPIAKWVSKWDMALHTGDVVVLNMSKELYLNERLLDKMVVKFEVTPDGRVVWFDSANKPSYFP
jgi:hypothetical protein